MKRLLVLIKKYLLEFIFGFSKTGRELNRIQKLNRFSLAETKIFGFHFYIVDSASFIGQYNEIIRKQIYKFKCDTNKPYIIDCGANIGVSILYFKTLFPSAEILAFEPDKNIFGVLKENLNNAKLSDTTIINKAVWDNDGIQKFSPDGADGGKICSGDFSNKLIEVETCRLKNKLIRPVDFLKMDIEGSEYLVIKDCDDNLKYIKNIFIEFHSANKKEQNLGEILMILQRNGFRYFIQQATIDCLNPFIMRNIFQGYDNLLNIFAYREN